MQPKLRAGGGRRQRTPGTCRTDLTITRAIALTRAMGIAIGYRKKIQNLWWAAGYNIVAIPPAAGAQRCRFHLTRTP